jgi:hypothetical protein
MSVTLFVRTRIYVKIERGFIKGFVKEIEQWVYGKKYYHWASR